MKVLILNGSPRKDGNTSIAVRELIACLDRLFYSTGFDETMKVGAAVAVARRGGCSVTFLSDLRRIRARFSARFGIALR